MNLTIDAMSLLEWRLLSLCNSRPLFFIYMKSSGGEYEKIE